MADTKKKYESFITPAGLSKFVAVQRPFQFKEGGPLYVCDVVISKKEAAAFTEKFTKLAEGQRAEAMANPKIGKAAKNWKVQLPISAELDEEGEETGNFILKAKQKPEIKLKDGTTRKLSVVVVDSKKKPVTKSVGSGSKVRMNVTIAPYYHAGSKAVGVTLRLDAVQVIDLKEYVGRDASAGFAEEEGGYEDDGEGTETSKSGESEGGDKPTEGGAAF